jgi:hypothetical protein
MLLNFCAAAKARSTLLALPGIDIRECSNLFDVLKVWLKQSSKSNSNVGTHDHFGDPALCLWGVVHHDTGGQHGKEQD